MIDFIKLQLLVVNQHTFIQFLSAQGIHVQANFNYETGEASNYPLTAEYKTLKISFRSPTLVELTGSLHKFIHDGKNYSDFFFNDLLESIFSLCKIVHLNPYNSVLHNVEFGVNIQPPFVTKRFLKQVISYGGVGFTSMNSKDGHSLGIVCQRSGFRVKMYCKKSQYSLPLETMRFEIHAEKMQYLTEKGIAVNFLADLLKIENLKLMGIQLQKVFNDIVIIDKTIQPELLSKPERKIFEIWSNPVLVEELHDSNTKKFQFQRRRLREIQSRYSKESQQQIAAALIKEKVNALLQTDEKTSTILTNIQSQVPSKNFNHSGQLQKVGSASNFNLSSHSDKQADSLKISPTDNDSSPALPKAKESDNWDKQITELEDYFKSISRTPTRVNLDNHTTITNVPYFIHSHLSMVKANNGNRTLAPYIERLIKLKDLLS